MDVVHVARSVSDIDATLEFYEEGIGLAESRRFTGEEGIRNVYVAGQSATELQFTYHPEEPPADPGDGPRSLRDHVAVAVEDVDATFRRLVETLDPPVDAEPYDEAASGSRIAFVRDPDGYVVELVERSGRSADS